MFQLLPPQTIINIGFCHPQLYVIYILLRTCIAMKTSFKVNKYLSILSISTTYYADKSTTKL